MKRAMEEGVQAKMSSLLLSKWSGRQEEGFRPLRPQPVHVQSSDLFWRVMGQLLYVIVLHGPIVNDEFILPMHLQLA